MHALKSSTRKLRSKFIGVAIIFATLVLAAPRTSRAVSGSWIGGSGNWNDSTHWSSNPQVPNDYPSTSPTSSVSIGGGTSATFTVTISNPTTVYTASLYDPNATIAIDSADGGSLQAIVTYYYNGTMTFNSDATLAQINSTQNSELEVYDATINGGGYNLTNDRYIAGYHAGSTFNISNVNVLANYGLIQPDGTTFNINANSFINHGSIGIADGGILETGSSGLNLADGTLDDGFGGTGTIDGPVSFTNATIVQEGCFTTSNSCYDMTINSSQPTTLAGTLDLIYPDSGGQPIPANGVYTMLSNSAGIAGQFSNVPNGSRLSTTNHLGSFIVTYETNSVVLSNWIATPPPNVPEPAGLGLLAAGELLLMRRSGRRHR
jgi:hypothetical protein